MSNDKDNLEEMFYNILAEGRTKESSYDHLVLFSGGKDSTYMAHKLKQSGSKVCLFSVDNGFEDEAHTAKMQKAAEQLNLDLYIYKPPIEDFIKFYRLLITEDLFKEFDSNPLCFLCARNFISIGLSFADKLDIPFVSYGATPMQLTGNKLARNLKDIELFEPVTKMYRESMYSKTKKLKQYNDDPVIKELIDRLFYAPQKAKLVYPFQYLDYNIKNIISTLEKEYGWQPPSDKLSKKEDNKFYYVSLVHDKNKNFIFVCAAGQRAYRAYRFLAHTGFDSTTLSGGYIT